MQAAIRVVLLPLCRMTCSQRFKGFRLKHLKQLTASRLPGTWRIPFPQCGGRQDLASGTQVQQIELTNDKCQSSIATAWNVDRKLAPHLESGESPRRLECAAADTLV